MQNARVSATAADLHCQYFFGSRTIYTFNHFDLVGTQKGYMNIICTKQLSGLYMNYRL